MIKPIGTPSSQSRIGTMLVPPFLVGHSQAGFRQLQDQADARSKVIAAAEIKIPAAGELPPGIADDRGRSAPDVEIPFPRPEGRTPGAEIRRAVRRRVVGSAVHPVGMGGARRGQA